MQWVTGYITGGKAAGAWSWPLSSISCRGYEWVELYLYAYMPSWFGQGQLYVYNRVRDHSVYYKFKKKILSRAYEKYGEQNKVLYSSTNYF